MSTELIETYYHTYIIEKEYNENNIFIKDFNNLIENIKEIENIKNIDNFAIEDNYFKIKVCDNKKEYIFKRPVVGLVDKLEEIFKENSFDICKGNDLHNKKYKFYCKLCNKNICSECSKNHNHHQQYLFSFDQWFQFYLIEGEKIHRKLNEYPIIDDPYIFNLAYYYFANGKFNNYTVFSIIIGHLDYLKNEIG